MTLVELHFIIKGHCKAEFRFIRQPTFSQKKIFFKYIRNSEDMSKLMKIKGVNLCDCFPGSD